MAKASGGTRNYSNDAKVMNTRLTEFSKLMSTGDYDASRSYFDESGGFVITHKGHNKTKPAVDGVKENMEEEAALALAKKGYKVYMDSEQGTMAKVKMPDGRVYQMRMDIKTINNAGEHTIEGAIRDGIRQIVKYENVYNVKTEKHAVVLYQGTKAMDKKYVLDQIDNFKKSCYENPKNAWMLKNIDVVIVVGQSGNVHRHFIK